MKKREREREAIRIVSSIIKGLVNRVRPSRSPPSLFESVLCWPASELSVEQVAVSTTACSTSSSQWAFFLQNCGTSLATKVNGVHSFPQCYWQCVIELDREFEFSSNEMLLLGIIKILNIFNQILPNFFQGKQSNSSLKCSGFIFKNISVINVQRSS